MHGLVEDEYKIYWNIFRMVCCSPYKQHNSIQEMVHQLVLKYDLIGWLFSLCVCCYLLFAV